MTKHCSVDADEAPDGVPSTLRGNAAGGASRRGQVEAAAEKRRAGGRG